MAAQVLHAVGPHVPAFNDNDFGNAGMVNHLRAHDAGFTRHDEPGVVGADPIGGGIADHVHFSVMAADFHSCARLHPHRVAEALFAAAERAAASGSTVVAIHEHHIAFRIDQERPELSPGAVRGFGKREALLDANTDVLLLHRGRSPHSVESTQHRRALAALDPQKASRPLWWIGALTAEPCAPKMAGPSRVSRPAIQTAGTSQPPRTAGGLAHPAGTPA